MKSLLRKPFLYVWALLLLFSCSNDPVILPPLSKINKELTNNLDTNNKLIYYKFESDCSCRDTLVTDNLHSKAPFDKVGKIVLYEFDSIERTYPNRWEIATHAYLQGKSIKRKIDITNRKDALANILLNKTSQCGHPRIHFGESYYANHCILFYNQNEKPTDFIEISFSREMVITSKRNYFGVFCGETFCELRNLFKEVGYDTATLYLNKCIKHYQINGMIEQRRKYAPYILKRGDEI